MASLDSVAALDKYTPPYPFNGIDILNICRIASCELLRFYLTDQWLGYILVISTINQLIMENKHGS